MFTGRLHTRLVRLEAVRAAHEPSKVVLSPERLACVQRLADRFYADPVLYAPQIRLMECVNQIVKWNGATWETLGGGLTGSSSRAVHDMVVFDDGRGPALFVAGFFTGADGVTGTSAIARWDGTEWSSVGGGFVGAGYSLKVFDDGTGPELYMAGAFSFSNSGNPSNSIAKWDGNAWSGVGSGFGSPNSQRIQDMCVVTKGQRVLPGLYVVGDFTLAGGQPAVSVARWDGIAWSALGPGLTYSTASWTEAMAIAAWDSGAGLELYVAGCFDMAGSTPVNTVARWDGSAWHSVGTSGPILACSWGADWAVHDDGSGEALYLGSFFTSFGADGGNLAKWDGAEWSSVGSESTSFVDYLESWNGQLVAGTGYAPTTGGAAAVALALWDGQTWSPMGQELGHGLTMGVAYALAEFDDGSGKALYVAGDFEVAGQAVATRVAKWDGDEWQPVGEGFDGPVYALAVFDQGGPKLWAGGNFSRSGTTPAHDIARWNGTAWEAVGGGTWSASGTSKVTAMQSFNSGAGPTLYVGGTFDEVSGVPQTKNLAKWQGVQWWKVGNQAVGPVEAMTVYNDGSGPALYVACTVSAVGANHIAKWNGSAWSTLGQGLGASALALTVYDDGSGPVLVAGGNFESVAGGVTAGNIAQWDGSSWQPIGTGVGATGSDDRVLALAVAPASGKGSSLLIAGGGFNAMDGVATERIAYWDGDSWNPLEIGLDNDVEALHVLTDTASERVVCAGGSFRYAGGIPSRHIALWTFHDQVPCQADVSAPQDCVVGIADLLIVIGAWGQSGASPADVTGDSMVGIADLLAVIGSWGPCP